MGSERISQVIDIVVEEARLESRREARRIVGSVGRAMAGHFPEEAWSVVSKSMPDTAGPRSDDRGRGGADVDAFFEEIAEYEELSPAVAARYARIVAEAVKRTMLEPEVARLTGALPNEYLALFESDQRGELTEPDGRTVGAAVVEEKEGHSRQT